MAATVSYPRRSLAAQVAAQTLSERRAAWHTAISRAIVSRDELHGGRDCVQRKRGRAPEKKNRMAHAVDWLSEVVVDAVWLRLLSAEFQIAQTLRASRDGFTSDAFIRHRKWTFVLHLPVASALLCVCKTSASWTTMQALQREILACLGLRRLLESFDPANSTVFLSPINEWSVGVSWSVGATIVKELRLHAFVSCVKQRYGDRIVFAGGLAAWMQYRSWGGDERGWDPSDVDLFFHAPDDEVFEMQQTVCAIARWVFPNASTDGFPTTPHTGYPRTIGERVRRLVDFYTETHRHLGPAPGFSCSDLLRLVHATHREDAKSPSYFRSSLWYAPETAHDTLCAPLLNLVHTESPPLDVSYERWILDGFDLAHCAVSATPRPDTPYWSYTLSSDTKHALRSKILKPRPWSFAHATQGKRLLWRLIKYHGFGFHIP